MEKDPKDGALVEAHMFELSQLATLMSGKESKKTAAAMLCRSCPSRTS